MTYTGLELFMENLMQLSYSKKNPIVNSNALILSKRPQMQLLYQELGHMIQILFVEEQDDLHEIRNLKIRFKDVVQEAHSIVGVFVYSTNYSSVTCRETYSSIKYFLNCMKVKRSTNSKYSLNLEDVMRSLKSIKEELTTILSNRKTDSSRSIDSLKTQTQTVVGTCGTRNLLGTKKVLEETIVGLVRDVELIRDKLVEDQKQLDVVSVVGMGGLALGDVANSWDKCFPRIKKLTCTTLTRNNQDFKSLSSLETLMWINIAFRKIQVMFPDSLKKLSLSGCCLPWSDVSIVQSLPNLEGLYIEQWEASSICFPCLTHLVLHTCRYLKEIPLEIGYISTLELIDVDDSNSAVVESLEEIQEEQQNFGNYDLKINVRKELHQLAFYRKLRGLAWTVDW
ncbi:hypothetical protein L1987_12760 [Smallanthus sonchifolius]|uniref:Uncharacterized protein n=1 Tax=Smallanthus sonchifolius TaxID=185202 RepID=A0ACB9JG67_9ASTR|nr:hypothetical protein L1987_12760 [Smallanthus sonchifolius]